MTIQVSPEFTQQHLEGRSVRDVVEYSSHEVNDTWCRKVLHKILKSLELQYAMEMPHRAVTPDTVVFHANGEPLLISDDIDAAPAPAAHLADDLTALACVIHFAITHELTPAGPLLGRVDGYSAAVVATVDACMDPDSALRPHSVDAVRGLLDMAAPLPAIAATNSEPAIDAHRAGRRRVPLWALAAGGGAIALALALVVLPKLRDAGSIAPIVVTPPHTGNVAQPVLPAPVDIAPVATVTVDAPTEQAAVGAADERPGSLASGASSAGTTQSGGDVDQPEGTTRVAPKPARAARTAPVPPPDALSGNASYQLHIKPWGVVYVDGVERGVSPPLKRLALTPGPHTIRITNPKYRDSILAFESAQTTSNGNIIIDFTDEAQ